MGDNPKDPRVVMSRHVERGPAKLSITMADIAEEFGLKIGTVYQYHKHFRTIEGIARFAAPRLAKQSTVLSEEEAARYVSTLWGSPEDWLKRWPRFDLYRCGVENCETISFEKGLCRDHGGAVPLLKFIVKPQGAPHKVEIALRIGLKYQSLKRLFAGDPADLIVVRQDGNRWNLHPSNLEIMTSDEFHDRYYPNKGKLPTP